jgi:lysophospholipase L1-like esterase
MNFDKSSVLFLGDSITKGVSMVNGRYRVLDNSFYNIFRKTVFSTTSNMGRFGLTSRKFLKDIFKLKNTDTDIVFFGIGGNDCNYNWKEISEHPDKEHYPVVSKNEYEDNLCRIYDSFKESAFKVVSMNFPPLHAEKFFNFLSANLSAENIMKWLKNVSRIYYHHESYNNIFETVTRSYNIDMIDIRSRFLLEEDLENLIGIDGMHPVASGHELIYKSINNYLLNRAAADNR